MAKHLVYELADILRPYIGHTPGCSTNESFSNPDSDYCDCGLAAARKKAQRIADQISGREQPHERT